MYFNGSNNLLFYNTMFTGTLYVGCNFFLKGNTSFFCSIRILTKNETNNLRTYWINFTRLFKNILHVSLSELAKY